MKIPLHGLFDQLGFRELDLTNKKDLAKAKAELKRRIALMEAEEESEDSDGEEVDAETMKNIQAWYDETK